MGARGVYWPELDGVRTLAFMLVFISHVGPLPNNHWIILQPVIETYNLIVKWGWTGVDLFLVLSGFLITHLLLTERINYGDISFKYFLIRRILRIWPLYYLVLILGFFILPLFNWMGFGYGSVQETQMLKTYFFAFLLFLGNLKFAQVITSISPVIASLWTVCLEEQFYFLWGGFLSRWNSYFRIILTLLTLLVVGIILRFFIQKHSLTHNPYYYNTFTHMDSLILGALAALGWLHFDRALRQWSRRFFLLAICIFIINIFFVNNIFQNKPSIVWTMTLVSISCSCFLISVLGVDYLRKFFSKPWLAGFGKITYGMYLFHFPILIACSDWSNKCFFNPFLKWQFNFWASLSLTFVLALLSWKFYEKPFNDLRLRFSPNLARYGASPSPLIQNYES